MLISNSIFFALPIPLSNPSLQSRLAAISVLKVDQEYQAPNQPIKEQIQAKELMLCKLAPHAQVSLPYLFSQQIDPSNLYQGQNALSFLTKVDQLLTKQSDNDCLICYSMRHILSLNAMFIQNFFKINILNRFQRILDLKTALATSTLFGNIKINNYQSLNKAALELGINLDPKNHLSRVQAMYQMYNLLWQYDYKIMTFLTAPNSKRLELCQTHPFLITIDDKNHLNVIKVLSVDPEQMVAKVIKNDGHEISLAVINLELSPLIAPTSILTAQRQQELNFFLEEQINKLQNTNFLDLIPAQPEQSEALDPQSQMKNIVNINDNDLPFYRQYFKHLKPTEKKLFTTLSNHDLRPQDIGALKLPKVNTTFGQQVLCYLNENLSAALYEEQKQAYANLVKNLSYQQNANFVRDYKILEQRINEKDEQASTLLARYAQYLNQI